MCVYTPSRYKRKDRPRSKGRLVHAARNGLVTADSWGKKKRNLIKDWEHLIKVDGRLVARIPWNGNVKAEFSRRSQAGENTLRVHRDSALKTELEEKYINKRLEVASRGTRGKKKRIVPDGLSIRTASIGLKSRSSFLFHRD